jgi:hypothetical protein
MSVPGTFQKIQSAKRTSGLHPLADSHGLISRVAFTMSISLAVANAGSALVLVRYLGDRVPDR